MGGMTWLNTIEVLHQMESDGLNVDDLVLDTGKKIKFGKLGSKKKRKTSWCVLHEFKIDKGVLLVGAYGDGPLFGLDSRKIDLNNYFDSIPEEQRNAERARYRAEQAERAARHEAEEKILRQKAEEQALIDWDNAKGCTTGSTYAKRKKIEVESARVDAKGNLYVPMINYQTRTLVGVQKIFGNGDKLFTTGCAKLGAGVRLGAPIDSPETFTGDILICEGYATGMSLRMASKMSVCVFVSFDAGGLLPLAVTIRELYPLARIIFCADDDFLTVLKTKEHPEGVKYNVGRIKAAEAAKIIGRKMNQRATVIYPVFAKRGENKWTDFNDLHVVKGLDEVARQLKGVLHDN